MRTRNWSELQDFRFEDIKGKVFKSIVVEDKEKIIFTTVDNEIFEMYHDQDCCECVEIEEIIGDLNNLLNTPIAMAEVETNSADSDWGSQTWTFYKLATTNGYITLRWLGESNGYYSEDVSFYRVRDGKELN